MKNRIKFIARLITAVILTLGLSISFQSLLAAWNAPGAAPPNDNPPLPIYSQSGSDQQIRKVGGVGGGLKVEGDITTNKIIHDSENPFYVDAYDTLQLRFNADGSATSGVFQINNQDNSTVFKILDNGNIGIGVDNPVRKLEVDGDINLTAGGKFMINGSEISAGGGTTYDAITDQGLILDASNNFGLEDCADGEILKRSSVNWICATDETSAAGSGINQATADARYLALAGGTMTGPIHLDGQSISGNGVGGIRVANDNGEVILSGGIRIAGTILHSGNELNHNQESPYFLNSYDTLQLRFNSSGSETTGTFKINNGGGQNYTVFQITNDGKVAINKGEFLPTHTLDVGGDINFTGDLYKNGNRFLGCVNECTTANARRCSSDDRYVQTCNYYNESSCLSWGDDTECINGCRGNACNTPNCGNFISSRACSSAFGNNLVFMGYSYETAAECLKACKGHFNTNIGCCTWRSSNNTCWGTRVSTLSTVSGFSASMCTIPKFEACAASYFGAGELGENDCPTVPSIAPGEWCSVSTQSYASHYCKDDILFVNCEEPGFMTWNYDFKEYRCQGGVTGYWNGYIYGGTQSTGLAPGMWSGNVFVTP